ncbi:MAG: sulfurtransferase-like selenium metabolism protein YedF [Bacteroidales bacterium]|nr:sulfurtransferase-like selenium metabolism protein YedF [Bacteroidales bacterium]
MKVIDVRGLKCPIPLIETKKALKDLDNNETLKIIIDNEVSKNNVLRFLKDNNIEAEIKQDKNVFELIINNKGQGIENAQIEEYCSTDIPGYTDFIVVFAKSRIGEGSEELGKILVNGFLNTFKEMEKLPQKIIFLNSGIDLVLKDSPAIPVLEDFEKKGVELLACGTCLEYYNKVDEVAVGKVSNAYDILNATINATKILSF